MEPFVMRMEVIRDKLYLQWRIGSSPKAICVAVGTSCDLVSESRIFILPPFSRNCELDLGPGSWHARVGAMIGDEYHGKLVWSGIYGPHTIRQSDKSVIPTIPRSVTVTKVMPIEGGVRFRFSKESNNYYIVERWEKDPVAAKWTYMRDLERGFADCGGMEFPTEYSIRVRELPEIPTQTIYQVPEGTLFEAQTSAKPTPSLDSTDRTMSLASKALIREMTFQRNVRFASHADYVRYQAALAKVGGGKA
jgi:hypothetical protein